MHLGVPGEALLTSWAEGRSGACWGFPVVLAVARGGSAVGSRLPKIKGGEAVPQGEQEVSGRHLGVPGDALEFFWASGSSGWLLGSPVLLAMAGLGSAGVPMLSWWKGTEAVPSGDQAWSGRHLRVPGNALELFWAFLAPRGGPGSTVVVDMPGTGPNPWPVFPMMEGGELLVPNASGRPWGESKVSGVGVAGSIASGAAWGLSVSLGGWKVPESPPKMV